MKGQTNRSIIDNALQRNLRSRMTDAENCLWHRLRGRQLDEYKFRRQHPFLDFVVDFVCLERQLIVEVDGGQHQDSARDLVRDQRLSEAGFRTLRFWKNQVMQETDAVVETIFVALREDTAPPESKDTIPTPTPQSQTSHATFPLKGRERHG